MFIALYNFFEKRVWLPRVLFLVSLATFALLASRVRFGEDISSMLPENRELQAMNNVISHTQAGEKLVFMASFKNGTLTDRDSLIAHTTAYYEGLQDRCRQWIDTINLQAGGGVEEGLAGIFTNHLPLFLTDEDYRSL